MPEKYTPFVEVARKAACITARPYAQRRWEIVAYGVLYAIAIATLAYWRGQNEGEAKAAEVLLFSVLVPSAIALLQFLYHFARAWSAERRARFVSNVQRIAANELKPHVAGLAALRAELATVSALAAKTDTLARDSVALPHWRGELASFQANWERAEKAWQQVVQFFLSGNQSIMQRHNAVGPWMSAIHEIQQHSARVLDLELDMLALDDPTARAPNDEKIEAEPARHEYRRLHAQHRSAEKGAELIRAAINTRISAMESSVRSLSSRRA